MEILEILEILHHPLQITEELKETIQICLAEKKTQAVRENRQEDATLIWGYETILRIQQDYIAAFKKIKEQYFYGAWGILEQIELAIYALEKNISAIFDTYENFEIAFIKKHIHQFQQIYPYKLFSSPGFYILEQSCTICEKSISIREHCGHIVGQVYDGKLCQRSMDKVTILEISLVKNPVQKYSVAFISGHDHYNYAHLNYVIRGLREPFHGWDYEWLTVNKPRKEYGKIGRNTLCPCGSQIKYKKCCIKKSSIESKHLQINFHVEQPSELPSYEENQFVAGKNSSLLEASQKKEK